MSVNPENDPTPISLAEFFWQDFMPLFAMMQSRIFANQFVLVEILSDLAAKEPDPQKYLAGIYDRVMGRFEQSPFDPNRAKQEANFKEAVDAIIIKAGQR
ncbi:hypothetical protein [Bradyrhizobium australafricanum]|uniref:hypothetical protein n=1 Tax=Bradyrhizobium australafricanum TaxID=2821406 RepID=UPI001CE356D4|nr:hypothetical protein [Bradyrhizobium australafricanum]MCA6105350.1 hypothetical protein [Bradyrhizobium australafricanum]